MAIGEDLPRVWHAATTPLAERKHLRRLVVKAVRVDQQCQPGKGCLASTWQSGARTVHELDRLGLTYQDVNGSARLKHRLHQLHAQRQSDAQVAQVLNAEGYRTAKGRPLRGKTVWYLRRLWGLSSKQTGEMTVDGRRWSDNRDTVRGVVQVVGVSKRTVPRWVKQGRLKGEYLGSRTLWRIHLTTRQINRLRKAGSATLSPSTAETITVT